MPQYSKARQIGRPTANATKATSVTDTDATDTIDVPATMPATMPASVPATESADAPATEPKRTYQGMRTYLTSARDPKTQDYLIRGIDRAVLDALKAHAAADGRSLNNYLVRTLTTLVQSGAAEDTTLA